MKRLAVFFCFVLGVFACSIVFAQIEKAVEVENGEKAGTDEEKGAAVEFASQWLSKYVSTGGVAFSKDPVLQSSLTLSFPNGLYGQVWHSTGFDSDLLNNPGAELDLYLGWSGKLGWNENPFLVSLDWDFYISYQGYSELSRMKDDFLGLGLRVKRPFELNEKNTLFPFIAAEYYYPLNGNGEEQGAYVSSGAEHLWKIWGPVSLKQSLRATYDTGVYGMESGFVGAYTASVQWKATDKLKVDLGLVQYTVPLSHFSDRKNEIVCGVGIRYEF